MHARSVGSDHGSPVMISKRLVGGGKSASAVNGTFQRLSSPPMLTPESERVTVVNNKVSSPTASKGKTYVSKVPKGGGISEQRSSILLTGVDSLSHHVNAAISPSGASAYAAEDAGASNRYIPHWALRQIEREEADKGASSNQKTPTTWTTYDTPPASIASSGGRVLPGGDTTGSVMEEASLAASASIVSSVSSRSNALHESGSVSSVAASIRSIVAPRTMALPHTEQSLPRSPVRGQSNVTSGGGGGGSASGTGNTSPGGTGFGGGRRDADVVLMAASEGMVYYEAFAVLDSDGDGWLRPGETIRFVYQSQLPCVREADALEVFVATAALHDRQASENAAAAMGVPLSSLSGGPSANDAASLLHASSYGDGKMASSSSGTSKVGGLGGGGLDYFRFVRVMRGDTSHTFKRLAVLLAQWKHAREEAQKARNGVLMDDHGKALRQPILQIDGEHVGRGEGANASSLASSTSPHRHSPPSHSTASAANALYRGEVGQDDTVGGAAGGLFDSQNSFIFPAASYAYDQSASPTHDAAAAATTAIGSYSSSSLSSVAASQTLPQGGLFWGDSTPVIELQRLAQRGGENDDNDDTGIYDDDNGDDAGDDTGDDEEDNAEGQEAIGATAGDDTVGKNSSKGGSLADDGASPTVSPPPSAPGTSPGDTTSQTKKKKRRKRKGEVDTPPKEWNFPGMTKSPPTGSAILALQQPTVQLERLGGGEGTTGRSLGNKPSLHSEETVLNPVLLGGVHVSATDQKLVIGTPDLVAQLELARMKIGANAPTQASSAAQVDRRAAIRKQLTLQGGTLHDISLANGPASDTSSVYPVTSRGGGGSGRSSPAGGGGRTSPSGGGMYWGDGSADHSPPRAPPSSASGGRGKRLAQTTQGGGDSTTYSPLSPEEQATQAAASAVPGPYLSILQQRVKNIFLGVGTHDVEIAEISVAAARPITADNIPKRDRDRRRRKHKKEALEKERAEDPLRGLKFSGRGRGADGHSSLDDSGAESSRSGSRAGSRSRSGSRAGSRSASRERPHSRLDSASSDTLKPLPTTPNGGQRQLDTTLLRAAKENVELLRSSQYSVPGFALMVHRDQERGAPELKFSQKSGEEPIAGVGKGGVIQMTMPGGTQSSTSASASAAAATTTLPSAITSASGGGAATTTAKMISFQTPGVSIAPSDATTAIPAASLPTKRLSEMKQAACHFLVKALRDPVRRRLRRAFDLWQVSSVLKLRERIIAAEARLGAKSSVFSTSDSAQQQQQQQSGAPTPSTDSSRIATSTASTRRTSPTSSSTASLTTTSYAAKGGRGIPSSSSAGAAVAVEGGATPFEESSRAPPPTPLSSSTASVSPSMTPLQGRSRPSSSTTQHAQGGESAIQQQSRSSSSLSAQYDPLSVAVSSSAAMRGEEDARAADEGEDEEEEEEEEDDSASIPPSVGGPSQEARESSRKKTRAALKRMYAKDPTASDLAAPNAREETPEDSFSGRTKILSMQFEQQAPAPRGAAAKVGVSSLHANELFKTMPTNGFAPIDNKTMGERYYEGGRFRDAPADPSLTFKANMERAREMVAVADSVLAISAASPGGSKGRGEGGGLTAASPSASSAAAGGGQQSTPRAASPRGIGAGTAAAAAATAADDDDAWSIPANSPSSSGILKQQQSPAGQKQSGAAAKSGKAVVATAGSTEAGERTATDAGEESQLRWTECIDPSSGYPYYFCSSTNESAWTLPVAPPLPPSSALHSPSSSSAPTSASQLLSDGTLKRSDGVRVCIECEAVAASRRCWGCEGDVFCSTCFASFHAKGKKRLHEFSILGQPEGIAPDDPLPGLTPAAAAAFRGGSAGGGGVATAMVIPTPRAEGNLSLPSFDIALSQTIMSAPTNASAALLTLDDASLTTMDAAAAGASVVAGGGGLQRTSSGGMSRSQRLIGGGSASTTAAATALGKRPGSSVRFADAENDGSGGAGGGKQLSRPSSFSSGSNTSNRAVTTALDAISRGDSRDVRGGVFTNASSSVAVSNTTRSVASATSRNANAAVKEIMSNPAVASEMASQMLKTADDSRRTRWSASKEGKALAASAAASSPPSSSSSANDDAATWQSFYDAATKAPFYVNSAAGESRWDLPPKGHVVPMSNSAQVASTRQIAASAVSIASKSMADSRSAMPSPRQQALRRGL